MLRNLLLNRSPARSALLIGVLLLVGACALAPTPDATSNAIPLPTNGGVNACAGVGFTGSVVLAVRDGKTLGRFADGREKPIFWPPRFTLVEDASLWRIVTPDGRLFATSGEDITAFMLLDLVPSST